LSKTTEGFLASSFRDALVGESGCVQGRQDGDRAGGGTAVSAAQSWRRIACTTGIGSCRTRR